VTYGRLASFTVLSARVADRARRLLTFGRYHSRFDISGKGHRMILKEAIEQFLFHCRYEKNLSPKTLKAYSIDLRQVADFLTANLPATHLEAIDKTALRLYIKTLFTGLAEKSVKRKVASLKSLFHFLEREDLIAVNPFRKMEVRIKETKRLPRGLSLPDLKRLFHHLYEAKKFTSGPPAPQYRALIRDIAVLETLFATGARVTEVCHLRLEDVDLTQGRIRILGKGARERLLQLPDRDTLTALLDYHALWLDPASPHPFFFHNRLGRRLSEQSVRSILRRHAAQAGLTHHLTPHMLRHSVATLLLEQGVDIRYIQHFLGHSSITTTQIYTAISDYSHMQMLVSKHPRNLLTPAR
jgi:integrase/recombinase XerD